MLPWTCHIMFFCFRLQFFYRQHRQHVDAVITTPRSNTGASLVGVGWLRVSSTSCPPPCSNQTPANDPYPIQFSGACVKSRRISAVSRRWSRDIAVRHNGGQRLPVINSRAAPGQRAATYIADNFITVIIGAAAFSKRNAGPCERSARQTEY